MIIGNKANTPSRTMYLSGHMHMHTCIVLYYSWARFIWCDSNTSILSWGQKQLVSVTETTVSDGQESRRPPRYRRPFQTRFQRTRTNRWPSPAHAWTCTLYIDPCSSCAASRPRTWLCCQSNWQCRYDVGPSCCVHRTARWSRQGVGRESFFMTTCYYGTYRCAAVQY